MSLFILRNPNGAHVPPAGYATQLIRKLEMDFMPRGARARVALKSCLSSAQVLGRGLRAHSRVD